jgi:hypothetical protein
MKISRFGVLLLAGLALPGVACSSSPSDSGTGGSAPVAKTTHISAADGGTVTAPDGTSLVIPAGALAADADITLGVGAAGNGAKSSVYTFGPDGLQFTKPATLSIKTAGLTPPAGQALALAVLDGTTWTPLAGSTVAGDAVSAPILHFSQYALVFSDNSAFTALCAANNAGFTACGGDPTGAWKLTEVCPGAGASLIQACTDKSPVTGKFKWTSAAEDGLVYTFSGGNTWQISPFAFDFAFSVESSCVACSIFDGSNGANCTVNGTSCDCTYKATNPGGSIKYTISGTNLVDATSMETSEFCVKPTELWIRDSNGTIVRLIKQ